MQGKSFSKTQRGLTLIEGCVTLAIASILVGTAAPSLIDSNKKRALDGGATELATDLVMARSEAVARGQGVRVSFHAVAGGTCQLVHTGSTADCEVGAAGGVCCAEAVATSIAAIPAANINFFIWYPFKVALPIVYGGKGFGANPTVPSANRKGDAC